MKQIRLILFLLLTVSVAFAQNEKTPKIEKAKILLDKGEVTEAKSIIDSRARVMMRTPFLINA